MATTWFRNRVNELFASTREMPAQAIGCLEYDDTRDAAEKAWCATDALVLACSVKNRKRPPGPRKVFWS